VTKTAPLEGCTGFDWDEGNVDKNWDLHRVAFWEAEEVFFNEPLVIRADPARSGGENRFVALGRTDSGRRLFLSFTLRTTLFRIISARGMTRREASTYEHTKA
jgi:uncharacterized protein